MIEEYAKVHNSTATCYQSNHEGDIVDQIQAADGVYDAIIINPAAYAHYSYAILDALQAVNTPAFEVLIGNIHTREPFRSVSVTARGVWARSTAWASRATCGPWTSSSKGDNNHAASHR